MLKKKDFIVLDQITMKMMNLKNYNLLNILIILLFLTACTPFLYYGFTAPKDNLETGRIKVTMIPRGIMLKGKAGDVKKRVWPFSLGIFYDTLQADIQKIQVHINYLKGKSGKILVSNETLEKSVNYTEKYKYYDSYTQNIVGQYGASLFVSELDIDYEDHELDLIIRIYSENILIEEKQLQFELLTDYEETIRYWVVQ